MVRFLIRRKIGARAVLSLLAWQIWFGYMMQIGGRRPSTAWTRRGEARACRIVLSLGAFMKKALRTA